MPTQDRSGPDHRELLLLLAARRAGVLDALATTTGTAEGVASETGLDERAARLLVAALADRGFLERLGGEYQPTNRMLGFLTKTDVRSIGRLPAALDAVEDWLALPETARGDDRPDLPDRTRNRLGAAAAADEAAVRRAVTAAVRECPDAEHVVTVHDAPGTHAVEFARRGFDVTLVDDPDAVAANDAVLEHEAVTLRAANPRDDLPDADLVFGADALRRYAPVGVRDLLASVRACRRSAERRPTAVFVDAVGGETPDAALLAVEAYARDGGEVHAREDLLTWLADAGFDGAVEPVPGDDRAAVVGRGAAGRGVD